uniref:Uncharacterized protein n=1 Tax=Myotis myotis TaxID=51298 RepID=A0A7J7YEX0_MYOMY|nr:hypothetical protein mMyoMyo1_010998 [Myotis myotis]
MSSLPNPRSSSCVSSPPRSEEQQFCEQAIPIRGPAAAHPGLRSSSHTSRPPMSTERQPCAACTSLRSRATHRLHLSDEQQPRKQPTPIQGAGALQSTCPSLRSSNLKSSPPHQRNNGSVQ